MNEEVQLGQFPEGRCHECVWFYTDLQNGGTQCRANPPVPFPVPSMGPGGQPTMQVVSFFPPVDRTSYCGMFESENAAPIDPPPPH
ncbi:MAG TPA: hypothetical protein VIY48_00245 [Candidatus Paceibacterota bacterium]